MIKIKQKGGFEKTTKLLNRLKKITFEDILNKYGEIGVAQLKNATPVDTGLTASSWEYSVTIGDDGTSKLTFSNTNIQNGVQIAILIQYGHATKNGGYVQGRDYINPALRPIMDALANQAWKEVSNL